MGDGGKCDRPRVGGGATELGRQGGGCVRTAREPATQRCLQEEPRIGGGEREEEEIQRKSRKKRGQGSAHRSGKELSVGKPQAREAQGVCSGGSGWAQPAGCLPKEKPIGGRGGIDRSPREGPEPPEPAPH